MKPSTSLRWGAVALSLCSCTLFAQTAAPNTVTDHNAHHNTLSEAPTADQDSSEGVIRRVDSANGKVTIKHGEIRNLDMPPMTMVFKATDPSLLQGLQAGDRVRFGADLVNGEYTLRSLERLQ